MRRHGKHTSEVCGQSAIQSLGATLASTRASSAPESCRWLVGLLIGAICLWCTAIHRLVVGLFLLAVAESAADRVEAAA